MMPDRIGALSIPAAVLGLSLIIAACIGSYSFYSVRSLDNTLVTTGSAKEAVRADRAKWTLFAQRITPDTGIAGAYTAVSRDTAAIKRHLTASGFAEEQIRVSPIFVDEYWGGQEQQGRRVMVRQEVVLESDDVDAVKIASENTLALAQQNVQFAPMAPEFYVSNLPDLRIALIGKAVEDARKRAESIGDSTGQRVGRLKSAQSGVVQVLQPNSMEVSDYGSYDTQTIEKEVMVSVRATFFVH